MVRMEPSYWLFKAVVHKLCSRFHREPVTVGDLGTAMRKIGLNVGGNPDLFMLEQNEFEILVTFYKNRP